MVQSDSAYDQSFVTMRVRLPLGTHDCLRTSLVCCSVQFTMQNRGIRCLKKFFNMERSKENFVRKNLKK